MCNNKLQNEGISNEIEEYGDEDMEMIRRNDKQKRFVKADKKDVLKAIKKCNKKYKKTMENLAK
jgi:hypothetical protein